MSDRLIASHSILFPREKRKRRCFGVLIVARILVVLFAVTDGQDFRIDNQLTIAANDCYTRIAIGSRMPDRDFTSIIPASSLSNCETACSANRTICNAFSFGIDARGNSTCAIGRIDLNTRGRDLVVDSDYDVYERRAKMPRGCQHDQLLRIGYGVRLKGIDSVNANSSNSNRQGIGRVNTNLNEDKNTNFNFNMNPNISRRKPPNPFGNIFKTGSLSISDNRSREPSFFRGGWYAPLADDSDSRLYDIINNKKNSKTNFWKQSSGSSPHVKHPHQEIFQPVDGLVFGINDPHVYRSTPFDAKWELAIPEFNDKWSGLTNPKWSVGFSSTDTTPTDISYTTPKDSPEHETSSLFDHGIEANYPSRMGIDSILERSKPCYRKLLVGKRLSDHHVRRSVRCNRIEECHRVCELESSFVCEGFNYGRMHRAGQDEREGYMCQLTSMSAGRMDLRRDFVPDPRYDYYERDWRCPAEKPRGNDWSLALGPRRPLWPPQSPPRPINQPTNELPRPLRRPGINRYPVDADASPGYYLSEKARPPINRPNDYDFYSRPVGYLPERPAINFQYHRPQQIPQYGPQDMYRPPVNHARPYGDFAKYPDRRVDQNGWQRPNEILPPRRDWQRPNGGSYVPHQDWPVTPVYGPSYGYHTNPYPESSEPPNRGSGVSYPDNDVIGPSKPASRPSGQHDYYGYHYGPAYGYGDHETEQQPADSYVPSWKPQQPTRPDWMSPSSWGGSRDCSVRSTTGFKLDRRCVTASYTTANLEECEMLCTKRRGCLSFAYRYSLAPTAPTDNCLLSDANFLKLNFYTDLVPDRDYDVYAMMGDMWKCDKSKLPNTALQPHRRPPEECFWRVRSGFGMPRSLTRKEFRADGIGECQIACVSVRHFTCRSFVFRYDSNGGRDSNCFLSDCPTSEIIPTAGSGLPYSDEAELYERGSYGRGCEPYPFATIHNSADMRKIAQWSGTRTVNRGDEGSCYSVYPAGCKLSPYAVSSMTRADSESECRRKCSKMRDSQHSPCMSFSYKVGDEKRGDNCYLSDVPRRDLRPGLDYSYDDDYVTYAWKELEPQCSAISPAGYPNRGFHGLYEEPSSNAPRPQTNGPPPPIGPGTGLLSFNHLLLGVRPLEPDENDPIGPANNPTTSPESHHNDDGYSYGLESHPNGFASFNRYYTVNGYPCKRGTKCEKNQVVGFWSCEPEGAELGSWDYCCEPNNHCGFSQGYRYPWCYVGPSEDQWRPCSEKYFPYLPSPRPAAAPPSRTNDHGPLNHHNYRPADQGSSTYHSRHWPIAYLHPVPPPNATDSVALANDRRDDPDPTTIISETSKPPPQTSDMKNSSITRLQLHKSYLKRRGLISNRSRLHGPGISEQKIHRIVIIPAVLDDTTTTSRNLRYSTTPDEHYSASSDAYADHYNSTEGIERGDEVFDVVIPETTTPEPHVNRRRASPGRIEKVTKATVSSRVTENTR